MHGLVSLLPQPYYQQVEEIWKRLEEECGLAGIKVTPYPHFSWQIAQDYDFDRLADTMREIAASRPPVLVRTSGIGLFTGPRPVIFVPVVKSIELMSLHEFIWEATQEVGEGISPFYSPEFWMPHISLAYEDVDHTNVAEVIGDLAFEQFNWEMMIDNIALIFEPTGDIGALKYQFKFG